MKIKQIESILKSSKTIIISKTDSCLWLSNGYAYYPIHNIPKLTKENIFTMFDIPEDKRNKFYCDERGLPDDLNFDDYDISEEMLTQSKMSIDTPHGSFVPLITNRDILFTKKEYLKPFRDMEQVELYLRQTHSGHGYIAVKNGMILVGVIIPYKLADENFLKSLYTIYELSFDEYRRRTAQEKNETDYQYSLDEREDIENDIQSEYIETAMAE